MTETEPLINPELARLMPALHPGTPPATRVIANLEVDDRSSALSLKVWLPGRAGGRHTFVSKAKVNVHSTTRFAVEQKVTMPAWLYEKVRRDLLGLPLDAA